MTTEKFYDDLASQYHLIAAGWDEAVLSQGRILSKLLGSTQTVLDCSCGIGTQAIGLALEGHQVVASDLSSQSIERARSEAKRFGVELDFFVSDFRELKTKVPGQFDCVLSCDNAVPHLLTESEMLTGFQNMRSKLKPEGNLLVSLRDYDLIRKEKPTGMPPKKMVDNQGERIYLQTWDWSADGKSYELELFLMKKTGETWNTESFKTTYRAWQREELTTLLSQAGFQDIEWLSPKESGYYQPIVRARV